jgi:uncharacterized membrane protein
MSAEILLCNVRFGWKADTWHRSKAVAGSSLIVIRKSQGATVLGPATPERLRGFSDGVFAVLITVLVLDLRPPNQPTYAAMLELWPRWLSYSLSYVFFALIWTNHHYLLRYVRESTPRLVWCNFLHLFSISFLPVATAWMATSRLAPQPVSFYAATIFLMNATYIGLVWEVTSTNAVAEEVSTIRIVRWRAVITLGVFGMAAVVALTRPIAAIVICAACLLAYIKPDPKR